MIDMLLRILLASYLAIWSPVMCCCSVKATLSAVTDVDAGGCHGRVESVTGSPSAKLEAAPPRGCCADRDSEEAAVMDIATAECAENQPSKDDPSPCRCHESLDTKVRLDTGAKIVVPALGITQIDLLPAFALAAMHTVAAQSAPIGRPPGVGWQGQWGDARPRRTTLLAQRCLLLI